MKRINAMILLVLLAAGSAFAQTWSADKAHSNIGFNATHMVVAETYGKFKDYEITVTSKSEDFNGAEVSFVAKTASINTQNERRDGHLKSDDFFSAEKFPELKFTGVLVKEGGKYKLNGDLTIRDVTKKVSFDVVYKGTVAAFGGQKAGFKLTGAIDRFEYGLKFDRTIESGGLVVGKEVAIVCNVEINKNK